ncbi:TPD1 protein homolog 1A-like [Aegilops tauschii subsp. strangulata]|uniref:TPD1 protein homolog 1A-like n=1 Tax=Aegilops tauschii subsp. strangulata TaxID=200361 RepID=UPI00098B03D6|nr:TPD1 protein homolog 1A-like [Aegilops tauschii subsp. strangulata]
MTTSTACSIAVLMATVILVAAATLSAAAGRCNVRKDLVIWQSLGEPQRDLSARYRVEVVNQCSGGDERTGRPCSMSKIHLRCGNFRSLVPVDPKLLRCIGSGVCLLNNGHSIPQNGNVSFVYANYRRNNLYVRSARCN